MGEQNSIIYWINTRDEIVFVNDLWDRIASADGNRHLLGREILGSLLWKFISGYSNRDLYKYIVKRVRGGKPAQFNFRCDTPEARRMMEMRITLFERDQIQFDSKTVCVEPRPLQTLLSADNRRSEKLVTVCGWCTKVNVGKEVWVEVEEAMTRLSIYEGEKYPVISHGICGDCYKPWIKKINAEKKNSP